MCDVILPVNGASINMTMSGANMDEAQPTTFKSLTCDSFVQNVVNGNSRTSGSEDDAEQRDNSGSPLHSGESCDQTDSNEAVANVTTVACAGSVISRDANVNNVGESDKMSCMVTESHNAVENVTENPQTSEFISNDTSEDVTLKNLPGNCEGAATDATDSISVGEPEDSKPAVDVRENITEAPEVAAHEISAETTKIVSLTNRIETSDDSENRKDDTTVVETETETDGVRSDVSEETEAVGQVEMDSENPEIVEGENDSDVIPMTDGVVDDDETMDVDYVGDADEAQLATSGIFEGANMATLENIVLSDLSVPSQGEDEPAFDNDNEDSEVGVDSEEITSECDEIMEDDIEEHSEDATDADSEDIGEVPADSEEIGEEFDDLEDEGEAVEQYDEDGTAFASDKEDFEDNINKENRSKRNLLAGKSVTESVKLVVASTENSESEKSKVQDQDEPSDGASVNGTVTPSDNPEKASLDHQEGKKSIESDVVDSKRVMDPAVNDAEQRISASEESANRDKGSDKPDDDSRIVLESNHVDSVNSAIDSGSAHKEGDQENRTEKTGGKIKESLIVESSVNETDKESSGEKSKINSSGGDTSITSTNSKECSTSTTEVTPTIKSEPVDNHVSQGVSIMTPTASDCFIKTEMCTEGVSTDDLLRTVKNEIPDESEREAANNKEAETTGDVSEREKERKRSASDEAQNDVNTKKAKLDDGVTSEKETGREGGKRKGRSDRISISDDDAAKGAGTGEVNCESEGDVSKKKARIDKIPEPTSFVDSDDENADDPEPMDTSSEPKSLSSDDARTKTKQAVLVDSDDENADNPSPIPSPVPSSCHSPTSPSTSSCPSPSSVTGRLLPALRALRRGALAQLTRSDLEELLVQKVCEAVTDRSPQLGELRRRCQDLEDDVDRWKEVALSCRKQLRELGTVLQKYLAEHESAAEKKQIVTPIRVTRSVGLQVAIGIKKVAGPAKSGPSPGMGLSRPVNRLPGSPSKLSNLLAQPSLNTSPAKPRTSAPMPPLIRPRPANKMMPARPSWASPTGIKGPNRPNLNSPKPQNLRPPLVRNRAPVDSGVIDLTDDGPSVSQSVIPSPGQKLAFVLPSGQGQPQKYLIATPTSVVKAPPNMLYKGIPQSQAQRLTSPSNLKQHPAPLPPIPNNQPYNPLWKSRPPRPALKISNTPAGIVLSWDMTVTSDNSTIKSYQLYAYQENAQQPTPSLWRQVGDVSALPLPMACTLSCFVPGHRYHFSVRAVDVHTRVGPFSFPGSILLKK